MGYASLYRSILSAAALFILPQIAFAITVKTVPWVADNPLIPHDTWTGKQVTLKGTSDVQGADIQYTWDYGDGSPITTGTVTNRYAIEALHTYTGLPGDVFTARLTVEDTSTGESDSKSYFVQIRERLLETEVNVAIDEGLWYLHKFQFRYTTGGVDFGDWRSGCNACAGYLGLYASNLNAFEANGHTEKGPSADPYVETVARGMRHLFLGLTTEVISNRTYPAPTGVVNPDSNGNGYGVRLSSGQYAYQGGMIMDAIIASGTPDAITTTGTAASGANPGINGRRYADIVQDMVDSYAFGQYNANSVNRGAWSYTWNSGLDNSVSQWAAIGMIPAERNWGLTVPDWVKRENEVALAYSQQANGIYGYNSTGPVWGPYATTPSGMVQMVMDGIGRGDARWDRSETYLRNTFANTGSAGGAIRSYYYGLFSFVKSMRLHQPEITLLGGDLDWYHAEVSKGAVTDGVARTLVNAQNINGYWYGHNFTGTQYSFETAWAILMLGQTLFESGSPVAVAQSLPNPAVAGQLITLNGGASFHQDSAKNIDSWEWDFDSDGIYDAVGAQATTSFPAVGNYPVTLRVTDDGTPEKSDTTVVTVRITLPPIAPTANAGGPYVFCPGTTMFLDGSLSNNPDEGQSEIGQPGDTIQSYQWDLDGNGDYADAAGVQPNVTAYFTGLGVGDYLVRLRTTDTTASSYPSSGMANLSDTDAAQVSVKDASDIACSCLADLASRVKSGKVQLTWTDNGTDHYNVYRGTTSGGPYQFIAKTTSRYSTYLDQAVVNGTMYHYIVRTAQASGRETCQSIEASGQPTATRRDVNVAPVITSTPVTNAVEGSEYRYDVQAIDAESGVITYSLDVSPTGMSIDPATGLILWVPLNAQVGAHNVAVRATDPLGLSGTQSFTVTVANSNRPPQFTSSPITDAIEGQPYSYDADAIDLDAGDTLAFSTSQAPAGLTIDSATGLISWVPTTAQIGNHLVTVVVTDAGGLSASQTFTIIVVEANLPPTITSTPITDATEGSLYAYDVDASDPNAGDILTFSLISPVAGMSIDAATGLINWTPSEAQTGDQTIQVEVTDQGGLSAIQSFVVRVAYLNDAPSITSTANTTATEGLLYQYSVTAVDPDLLVGDVITFSLDVAPAGMSLNAASGLIQWMPNEGQVGSQTVTVRVTDAGGLFATQTFVIVVGNQPDAPTIVTSPVTTATENQLYTYDVDATDPDLGDVITYSLTTSPTGMGIDASTGLIQWTPTNAQVGSHPVTVVATDSSALTAVQSFTIVVANVNEAPSITSTANLNATEGLLYQYSVIASDPDVGDTLTYSLDVAPAGMSIDANGLISWTPSEAQVGNQAVTVRVSDVGGLFDTQSFSVTVTNQPNAPSFTSSPITAASEGSPYAYDADATDPDVGDTLTYSLDAAPAGMTINSASGLVSWNPVEADIGSHSVIIRVTDLDALFATQSYSVVVADVPFAPVINSTPLTTATVGIAYNYDVNATDADTGDVITFSLDTAPAGMSIDSATGLIAWTPVTAQLGLNNVVVRASDGSLSSTQSFSIGVTDTPNAAPVITSTPVGPVTALQLWTYQITFTDADAGDTHTFSLPTAPSGMTVNATGLVSWTPTEAQVGSHPVAVSVLDNRGGSSTQSFTLTVDPVTPPQPPQITSTPVVSGVVGQAYIYDVNATDPNGDAITYSLSTAPAGMSINATSGVIGWIPVAGQLGANAVTVRASDATSFQQQSYSITVTDVALPLEVFVQATPSIIDQGQTTTVSAWTTGGTGSINLNLTINGVNTILDGSGNAIVNGDTIGGYELVASASDSIETISATNFFSVRDPSDSTAPTVAITSPVTDSEVTEPVDIIGTANDANLVNYKLLLAPAGTNSYTELAVSTTPVIGGVLGRLDPTLLVNGLYDVVLIVTDVNGQQSSRLVTYRITGDMKVGNFSFTVMDLGVELVGVPIEVKRTYDTRKKSISGDFGYGWHLDHQDVKIEENIIPGAAWNLSSTGGFFPNWCIDPVGDHIVSVTLPDGRTEEFDISVSPRCNVLVPFLDVSLVFTARNGTYSLLAESSPTTVRYNGGALLDIFGNVDTYNPDRYRLTTVDGYVYELDQEFGIRSVRDANSNSLTFNNNGYIHSSGKSVTFTRDSLGRVTQVTDPNGNSITYAYNARGELVSSADRAGYTTTYSYNRSHAMTEMLDPRGLSPSRNIYDEQGRLVAFIDPSGNQTNIDNNVSGRQEIVTDSLGNTTIVAYDDSGNILSRTDALGNTQSFTFDAQGRQLTQTDAAGNTVTTAYDGNGNLRSVTDALGNNIYVRTYNAKGDVLSDTDANGNVSTLTYALDGNITNIVNPLGGSKSVTYTASGLPVSVVDENGTTTSFTYDASGNTTSVTNPLGITTQSTFDSNGNELSQRSQRTVNGVLVDVVSQKIYSPNGELVEEIDALGNSSRVEYNSLGKRSAEIDKNGNRLEYAYDTNGNMILARNPDGTTQSNSYDANGNVIASTDQLGRITNYSLDILNRPVSTTYPDGSVETVSYDQLGRIASKTDANGNTTSTEYDAVGRPNRVVDALGNVSQTFYDANGNATSVIDARGNTVTNAYDALDRLVRVTMPNGSTNIFEYDALGRRTATIDLDGQRTEFEYDAQGQLTLVRDPLGNLTTYAYDEVGNRVRQTDANGNTTLWGYDNLGRVLRRSLPEGQVESYVYDSNGNALSHTDFNGNTITNQYDVNNRLTRKIYPDASTVDYTYTATGQVASMTDGRGVTDYLYDVRDRLVRLNYPDGNFLIYSYDSAGNVLTVQTLSGTTAYTYDALNRLNTVTDFNAGVTSYTYDSVGNRATITYPNGTVTNYTYDNLNRLTRLVNRRADSSIISSYDYVLGATGNRVSIVESNGRSMAYTYDALYRLTREVITTGSTTMTIDYTYDAVGNRLSKTIDSLAGIAYTYDRNDRLLTEGSKTYTYDNNGNTLTKFDGTNTTTYTYDYDNHMVRAVTPTDIINYNYDDRGLRLRQSVGGVVTNFIVDPNQPLPQVLEERDETNSLVVRYTYGDDLVSQTRGSVSSYYHYDGLGTTRVLTDSGASITDTYDYEVFGIITSQMGATVNNYLYTGEQYDPNVGFYYLRARYYDAAIGRFTSMDAYSGRVFDPVSLHKYLYANANPVNMVDPTGYFTMAGVMTGIGNTVRTAGSAFSGYFAFLRNFALRLLQRNFPEIKQGLSFLKTTSFKDAFKAALTALIAKRVVKNCVAGGNSRCIIGFSVLIEGARSPSGGVNHTLATLHHFDAIMQKSPALLARRVSSSGRWYAGKPECITATRANGLDCDEYPFNSTWQGGPSNYPDKVSLRAIPAGANRSIGAALKVFYSKCGVSTINPLKIFFGVVPIPGNPSTQYRDWRGRQC